MNRLGWVYNFLVSSTDLLCNLFPEILLLHSLRAALCCGLAKLRIFNQQTQHALQVASLAALNVNPTSRTTSRFSCTSLVRTHTPAPMASSKARDNPSRSEGKTKRTALVSSSSRSSP